MAGPGIGGRVDTGWDSADRHDQTSQQAMTIEITEERPLDPERPIIDPHLHLWEIRPATGRAVLPQRFLLPEVIEAVSRSGHNITHAVFVECHAMYREDGPPELRSIGETEFANGVAAMSASGTYGPCRIAHRIVGSVDLRRGARAAPILEAHAAAAGDRFRGVRFPTAFSEAGMFGGPCDPARRGVMLDPRFREGARILAGMDLSLDVWCFHSQLDELIDFARAIPDLTIVLDHVGTPESLGAYANRKEETRIEWARKIATLARCPNVVVKLGGLGMDVSKPLGSTPDLQSSSALADRWRPWIETCIEAFTPGRCMFESNFPPDNAAGTYGAIWNAFKTIVRNCSQDEQDQLFRRTAAQIYRIALNSAGGMH
jgi:predicted TIM-barrel fold metal-dependent hydrolase